MTPARKLKLFKDANPHIFGAMQYLVDNHKHEWADWCLLPIAGAIAAVTNGADLDDPEAQKFLAQNLVLAQEAAALFAWEKAKGVYRFDPDTRKEISSTPLDKLPSKSLMHLPEWCIFIEYNQNDISGVFVHLEEDANTKTPELRMLFLMRDGLTYAIPIILDAETLEESMQKLRESAATTMLQATANIIEAVKLKGSFTQIENDLIVETIKLAAYICSDEADIIYKPAKNKRRQHKGVPEHPTVWGVGERIGAALRRYRYYYSSKQSAGTGAKKRPHTRKAHWHHFWAGPNKTQLVCKWLPPIPVNWSWDMDADEMPVVIHKLTKRSKK